MDTTTNLSELLRLVFKGIAIAMAVSVIVLNILGVAAAETQIVLLAIGLFAIGLGSMSEEKR
ncbi:MAG TPA: hypothetical protein VFF68_00775 [Anaerolineaceae bacterium]|nr:hypothetical protein [Anaerolineaceae bacterium]